MAVATGLECIVLDESRCYVLTNAGERSIENVRNVALKAGYVIRYFITHKRWCDVISQLVMDYFVAMEEYA